MRTQSPIVRPTRSAIVQKIKAVHQRLDRVPTRAEFYRLSRLRPGSAERVFGRWGLAVRAAGLRAPANGVRVPDDVIFGEWGTIARTLKHIPSLAEYKLHTRRDSDILRSRCGCWTSVPHGFLTFANDKPEWRDVAEMVSKCVEGEPPLRIVPRDGRVARPAPDVARVLGRISRRIPDRAIQGGPLGFRSVAYEPDSELGVVLLFGVLAADLGYYVEKIRAAFPDCEAVRRVSEKHWQRVTIEFELESRNFRQHGHEAKGCDVIVCWRHNWPECPEHLEVVELSKLVRGLAG